MYEIRVYGWNNNLMAKYNAGDDAGPDGIVNREKARSDVAAIFVQYNGGRNKKVYGAKSSKNPNKKKK